MWGNAQRGNINFTESHSLPVAKYVIEHTWGYIHIYTHTHTYVCIYTHIHMEVCENTCNIYFHNVHVFNKSGGLSDRISPPHGTTGQVCQNLKKQLHKCYVWITHGASQKGSVKMNWNRLISPCFIF